MQSSSEAQNKFLNVEDSYKVEVTEFQHDFKDVEN